MIPIPPGRGTWWQVRRGLSFYGPVVIMHATTNGGTVLRGQASWHTISGVLVSSRRFKFVVWVTWRPHKGVGT